MKANDKPIIVDDSDLIGALRGNLPLFHLKASTTSPVFFLSTFRTPTPVAFEEEEEEDEEEEDEGEEEEEFGAWSITEGLTFKMSL